MDILKGIYEIFKDFILGGAIVLGFIISCFLVWMLVKYSPDWLLGGVVFIFFAYIIGHELRKFI